MSQEGNFLAFALGIGTKNQKSEWLEVYFPRPLFRPDSDLVYQIGQQVGYRGGNQAIDLATSSIPDLSRVFSSHPDLRQATLVEQMLVSKRPLVAVFIENDTKPTNVPEAYLKLHLLSHRFVKPHQTNLEGIFSLLPNVAWTNEGAVDFDELPDRQFLARLNGETLDVHSIDKFPKMTNYIVPSGVRIADTSRVRLGAYIGQGTTIMHEGFVNFNAGTDGPNMVEGRISAGVMVGKDTDLGGGCSTMGTLSGGNNVVISIGKECLVGANSGVGIPLGDRCTIEAGLYLTAGSKITILDDQNKPVEILKAAELSGKSDLLFRRNSQTGTLECKTNKTAIELNKELHSNN